MAKIDINTWDDSYCFACSPHNHCGLKLEFAFADGLCRTKFTPQKEHQGWTGFTHGGILSTILDEAMAQWLWHEKVVAMTASMEVRFRSAVPIGREVVTTALCTERKKHGLYVLEAEMTMEGDVVARASAKFLSTGQALHS